MHLSVIHRPDYDTSGVITTLGTNQVRDIGRAFSDEECWGNPPSMFFTAMDHTPIAYDIRDWMIQRHRVLSDLQVKALGALSDIHIIPENPDDREDMIDRRLKKPHFVPLRGESGQACIDRIVSAIRGILEMPYMTHPVLLLDRVPIQVLLHVFLGIPVSNIRQYRPRSGSITTFVIDDEDYACDKQRSQWDSYWHFGYDELPQRFSIHGWISHISACKKPGNP